MTGAGNLLRNCCHGNKEERKMRGEEKRVKLNPGLKEFVLCLPPVS